MHNTHRDASRKKNLYISWMINIKGILSWEHSFLSRQLEIVALLHLSLGGGKARRCLQCCLWLAEQDGKLWSPRDRLVLAILLLENLKQSGKIWSLGPSESLWWLLHLKRITNKTSCIAQGTLLNVMWQPGWEGNLGENATCICVSESLCRSPEAFTTLLIGYVCVQSLSRVRLLWPHGL